MNETILNGKLLTWTDRIFKQINIIEGTKKHNGNKTRFYTGKYFKETGSFYGADIWRTGFTESPLYRQEVIWSIWWCLP